MVRRAQAERRVGEDREKGDDPGKDQKRELRALEPDPDEDEGRNGNHGCDLQDDGIGKERRFDEPVLRKQDGKANTPDDREQEGGKRDPERDEKRAHERAEIGDETVGNEGGRGQNETWHSIEPHQTFPEQQHAKTHSKGGDDFHEAQSGIVHAGAFRNEAVTAAHCAI